jgi:hypothetical protein
MAFFSSRIIGLGMLPNRRISYRHLLGKLEQPDDSEKLKLIGFGLPPLAAWGLVLDQSLLDVAYKNRQLPVLGSSEHLTPFSTR